MTKFCTSKSCLVTDSQPLDHFNKNKGRYNTWCKSCCIEKSTLYRKTNKEKVKKYDAKRYLTNPLKAEQSKLWKTLNPEKRKDTHLKSKFGITLEQYNQMLKTQNNLCAICRQPETARHIKGKLRDLAVDHDHNTKIVRKLLCFSCNSALGIIKENFDVAINLAKYIQEWKNIT